MFESATDILAQLDRGEDEHAEFKEVRLGDRSVVSPTTESIAGEIVAFANNGGGTLFFGIADDGSVRGIPEPMVAVVEQWATNIALHNCDPPLSCRVRRVELPGPVGPTAIVTCEVPVGLSVHRSSGGRYYVRSLASKRDLTAAELAQLFQERGRYLAADEQPVRTASLADLDAEAVRAHLGGRNGVAWPDLLRLTKVLTPDDIGEPRPTVAALVAFGRGVQEHLPFATIEAAAFRAGDKSSGRITHAERMSGPCAAQVAGAVDFVREAARRLGARYALGAVQEAVENAVRHRDYGRVDAKIRLCLFADRLELTSPGRPPNTVTPASLPYRRFTRNQLLARFLGQPNGGRSLGVAGLLHDCERASARRPDYRMAGDDLVLTIWAAPFQTDPV